jgi:hypothetical protein
MVMVVDDKEGTSNNHSPCRTQVCQDHPAQILALLSSNSGAAVRKTECVPIYPHGGTALIAAGVRPEPTGGRR